MTTYRVWATLEVEAENEVLALSKIRQDCRTSADQIPWRCEPVRQPVNPHDKWWKLFGRKKP